MNQSKKKKKMAAVVSMYECLPIPFMFSLIIPQLAEHHERTRQSREADKNALLQRLATKRVFLLCSPLAIYITILIQN
jgi:hypothetical protein